MYAKNRIGKSEPSNELSITADEAGMSDGQGASGSRLMGLRWLMQSHSRDEHSLELHAHQKHRQHSLPTLKALFFKQDSGQGSHTQDLKEDIWG